MANPSKKDRLLVSIAKPIVHPARYRNQFRIAGGIVVVGAAVYVFLGSLAFIGLVIVGGVASRYFLKYKWNTRKSLPR